MKESLLIKYLSASYEAVNIDKYFDIRAMVCRVGAKWSAFRTDGKLFLFRPKLQQSRWPG
jgi:hypothetical protein